MSRFDRGIIYLMLGTKHLPVLAVSVFTLRKHWRGPVTIFADAAAMPICLQIVASCDAEWTMAIQIEPPRQRRNTGYATKPRIPAMSPYARTIQIDADTVWAGSPEPLFDMIEPRLCLVTQFCNWVTTGPRVSGRVRGWLGADRARAQRCLDESWPALNTGTVAYGCESPVAREAWLDETLKQPTIFMGDELAFNIIVPDYAGRPDLLRVIDDQFNCCPRWGVRREDAKVYHLHGHGKIGRLPEYQRVWLPEFHEAWGSNFGRMREWLPGLARDWLQPFIIEEVARCRS